MLRRSTSSIGIESLSGLDRGIRKAVSLHGLHQFESLGLTKRQQSESTPDLRKFLERRTLGTITETTGRTHGSVTETSPDDSSAPGSAMASRKNLALICFLAVIDGMDIQLLPASFKALESDLGLTPTNLALLAVCQGYAMCISGPFWGAVADSGFPRKWLLAMGSAMWGVLTLMLALCDSFHFMVVLRTLNGIALGLLLPVIQSLIAEISSKSEMGFSFGCIDFCHMAIGQAVALVVISSTAGETIWGMPGWRVAFGVVAGMSILVAIPILVCIEEKPRPFRFDGFGVFAEARKFLGYMRTPTFLVLVSQGVFGTIPGSAMAFTNMYFQYIGVGGSLAGIITAFKIIGTGIGAVLGGIIGDVMALRSPLHGRALCAQASTLLSIPIAAAVFLVVPPEPSLWTVHSGLLFLLGLVHWCSAGCNRPILVEMVEPESIGSVVAWQNCIEHMSGFILGPVGVAVLSEMVFNYVPAKQSVREMPQWERDANAVALGQSLALCTSIPWVACFIIYGLLHYTYPDHRRRFAKAEDGSHYDQSSEEEEASEYTPLTRNVTTGSNSSAK